MWHHPHHIRSVSPHKKDLFPRYWWYSWWRLRIRQHLTISHTDQKQAWQGAELQPNTKRETQSFLQHIHELLLHFQVRYVDVRTRVMLLWPKKKYKIKCYCKFTVILICLFRMWKNTEDVLNPGIVPTVLFASCTVFIKRSNMSMMNMKMISSPLFK